MFEDYKASTKEEKICLSIFSVIGFVDNEGTSSLYYNTYAYDIFYDKERELEKLGIELMPKLKV